MDNNKYELFFGKKLENKLFSPKLAGFAFYCDEHQYFSFRLCMFPRIRYFVKRNFESMDTYTIYSKIVQDESECKLLEPVGVAMIANDFKNYLSLRFHMFPHLNVYLGLFPKA